MELVVLGLGVGEGRIGTERVGIGDGAGRVGTRDERVVVGQVVLGRVIGDGWV